MLEDNITCTMVLLHADDNGTWLAWNSIIWARRGAAKCRRKVDCIPSNQGGGQSDRKEKGSNEGERRRCIADHVVDHGGCAADVVVERGALLSSLDAYWV